MRSLFRPAYDAALGGFGLIKGLRYAFRRRRNTRRPNINSLNNRLLYEHIKNLNGRNLARLMMTSRKFRNFIRGDTRLMAKINQAKRNVTRRRIIQYSRIADPRGWPPHRLFWVDAGVRRRAINQAMLYNNHPLTITQISRIVNNLTVA
jgi:hypothetical protein